MVNSSTDGSKNPTGETGELGEVVMSAVWDLSKEHVQITEATLENTNRLEVENHAGRTYRGIRRQPHHREKLKSGGVC